MNPLEGYIRPFQQFLAFEIQQVELEAALASDRQEAPEVTSGAAAPVCAYELDLLPTVDLPAQVDFGGAILGLLQLV